MEEAEEIGYTRMDEQQKRGVSPITLFYSYAHEDESLRNKLEKHLIPLRRQGLISEWHDRKIVPGTEWAYAIDSHLQTASIILLLISPAFMASDYCVSIEMQKAMERHRLGDARVIPIILEPTAWHDAPFAILQCLPRGGRPVTTWDNPEDAFEDIAQGLRRAIEEMNLLYTSGPHRPSAPMLLAPADGQWRKVSNHLPSQSDSQSRKWMLERVRAQWITGLLKDSLHEAALITLGLHEQPDAVANPWSFSLQEMNQPARPLLLGTRIIQAYDYAQGELLILGEPGSGKTTLLLELTRDLIERAKRDEAHPIPVVFNLSSWILKQQPIASWLVEELILKYQVPRVLAQRWVKTEQILPLLDGLDEVAPNHRAACIEALNEYRNTHGLLPTVVCSRSAEYLDQKTRVLLRTAVVVQPLTPEQIEIYLKSAKQQLASVREALRTDEVLQEMVATPMMLSIVTLAYHGASIEDLLMVGSPETRRQRVFATYIERMLQRRAASHYTPDQVKRWLAWLAWQMVQHGQTEFYLEQMQPNWLEGPQLLRHTYRAAVRMGTGLVGGLLGGLSTGLLVGLLGRLVYGLVYQLLGRLVYGLAYGLVYGLVYGLLVGLLGLVYGSVYGLLVGLTHRVEKEIKPAEVVIWSWKGMWQNLAKMESLRSGLLVGLVVGLVFGLLAGLSTGLVGGLTTAALLFDEGEAREKDVLKYLTQGQIRLELCRDLL
jgi:DNA polymerase III delta prime subunit